MLREVLIRECELLENSLDRKKSIIISKSKESEKKYKKTLKSLQTLLINTYDSQSQKAIKEVIDYIYSLDKKLFSESDIKKIDSILKSRIGIDLKKLIESRVDKIIQLFYLIGAEEITDAFDFEFSFEVPDEEAIASLSEQFNFWIGNYYGEQIQTQIKDTLKGYFDSNKTIEEVAVEFSKLFEKYTNNGMEYFEGLAEHTSNRIRVIGQVTGMEKAGIEFYQILSIIDARTSEICRFMDGKIFKLSRAIEYRDKILSLKNPKDIKEYSKWISPKELSEIQENKIADPDLPAGLTIPPFHWRCRSTIRAYFE